MGWEIKGAVMRLGDRDRAGERGQVRGDKKDLDLKKWRKTEREGAGKGQEVRREKHMVGDERR